MKVKVAQSCPTLWDPMNYRVHGILQARILEWVAFPFSRGSSQPRDRTQVSHNACGFFTSWATWEAQEYWSLSLLQHIFPTQESNWGLPALQVDSLPTELSGKPKVELIWKKEKEDSPVYGMGSLWYIWHKWGTAKQKHLELERSD